MGAFSPPVPFVDYLYEVGLLLPLSSDFLVACNWQDGL